MAYYNFTINIGNIYQFMSITWVQGQQFNIYKMCDTLMVLIQIYWM